MKFNGKYRAKPKERPKEKAASFCQERHWNLNHKLAQNLISWRKIERVLYKLQIVTAEASLILGSYRTAKNVKNRENWYKKMIWIIIVVEEETQLAKEATLQKKKSSDGTERKFLVNTGSPVTGKPSGTEAQWKIWDYKSLTTKTSVSKGAKGRYSETAGAENKEVIKKLNSLNFELEEMMPLLGMNMLRKVNWMIQNFW